MSYRKARGLAVACGAVLVLLAPAAPTSAGLLDCLFGPPDYPCSPQPVVLSRTTYMPRFVARPVYAAPACSPCVVPSCSTCATPACTTCVAQTVRYTPQTCYRSLIQTVPVTSYRAAVGCDPCTGCCQTCYRPVTTYVRRVQLVPYTTYRMALYDPCVSCAPSACVWSPGSACLGSGVGCYSGCSAGFGTMPGTIVPGGCSSCTVAPQATISPGAMTVAPSGPPAASVAAPGGSASTAAGQTFREGSGAETRVQKAPTGAQGPELEGKPEPKLRPQPMHKSGLKQGQGAGPRIAPFGTPQRIDPNDRTTGRPIRPAVQLRPAGWTPGQIAPPAKPVIDDGGWRPARD